MTTLDKQIAEMKRANEPWQVFVDGMKYVAGNTLIAALLIAGAMQVIKWVLL